MLDSALKMKQALLRVHKKGPLKGKFTLPTDTEWKAIENLRSALLPIEILTKYLCQENVTLLQAEDYFQSASRALRLFNNDVATSLRTRLEKRYKQRHNVNLLSILTFTLNPADYSRKITMYDLLDVAKLQREITNEYNRMFPVIDEEDSDMEVVEQEEADDPRPEPVSQRSPPRVNSDMERMMQFFKSGHDFVPPKVSAKPALDSVDAEVTRAFETGEVMERLKRLECALKSLPASSVDCERSFSTIGLFHSKIRNRLSDVSLDYMSFGKHYLKNEKRK